MSLMMCFSASICQVTGRSFTAGILTAPPLTLSQNSGVSMVLRTFSKAFSMALSMASSMALSKAFLASGSISS